MKRVTLILASVLFGLSVSHAAVNSDDPAVNDGVGASAENASTNGMTTAGQDCPLCEAYMAQMSLTASAQMLPSGPPAAPGTAKPNGTVD